MLRLRRELGMALILITHDLGVVAGVCDRIAVMYAGYIVEEATAEDLFAEPRHPYTLGLLRSLPRIDEPRRERLVPIEGLPPDLVQVAPRLPLRTALYLCRGALGNGAARTRARITRPPRRLLGGRPSRRRPMSSEPRAPARAPAGQRPVHAARRAGLKMYFPIESRRALPATRRAGCAR